ITVQLAWQEGSVKRNARSRHVSAEGIMELARVFQREDLLAIDGHVVGGLDPDAYRVAIDLHDRDPHILTHLEPLTELPAQDQHGLLLLEIRLTIGPPASSP